MTVTMSYNGEVIGSAATGESKVPLPNEVKGTTVLTVPATAVLNVPDKGVALTAFAKDLIELNTLSVDLHGDTSTTAYCPALAHNMSVTGIPIRLPDETVEPALPPVTIKGMNGLSDVTITS